MKPDRSKKPYSAPQVEKLGVVTEKTLFIGDGSKKAAKKDS